MASKTARPSKCVPRPNSGEPTAPRVKKKGRTAEEIEHQGEVASLGCVVCRLLGDLQVGQTEIHHVRKGNRRDESHFNVLPLCFEDHRGKHGIHGDKERIKRTGKTDSQLLKMVNELIKGGSNDFV